MKLKLNKIFLIFGLQNIIQIGLIYPLHLLAVLYYSIQIKLRIKTNLDLFVAIYILFGFFSFFIGVFFSFYYGYISEQALGFLKSFFVFMTCIVYFGVSSLKVEEFIKVTMWLFTFIAIAILFNYIYLFIFESFSLYQLRGQISWVTGWPQRWVVFAMIAHFFFYVRYSYLKEKKDLFLAILLLSIVFLSSTRSIVAGMLIGHIILMFMSFKDFKKLLLIGTVAILIVSFYWKDIENAFRIVEIIDFTSGNASKEGSLGYRLYDLWPGLIGSLNEIRIIFGWGHIGPANIPNLGYMTSESQYVDVLVGNGLVGLMLYITILLTSIFYSYKLYKYEKNLAIIWIWKASFIWQFVMLLQGLTVETTRYSLYGLYYFLFLGLLSINYHSVRRKKN